MHEQRKNPTLKDIAGKLNISTCAVSQILNGKGEQHKLSAKTIRRTQEYAAAIGYHPQIQARNLRLGNSGVIGLCFENDVLFKNDTTNAILKHLLAEVANQGLSIVCLGSTSHGSYRENLEQYARYDLDGLIVHYTNETAAMEYLEQLRRQGVKIVMLLDTSHKFDGPRIDFDYRAGGEMITGHLLAQGYRRIAHIGACRKYVSAVPRFQGYLDALAKAGIPRDDELIFDLKDLDYRTCVDRLLALPQPPDAIFCLDDLLALNCLRYMESLGKMIPVGGFDNREFLKFIEYVFPTVGFPLRQVAAEAVRMLANKEKCGPVSIIPELITIDDLKKHNILYTGGRK